MNGVEAYETYADGVQKGLVDEVGVDGTEGGYEKGEGAAEAHF